MMKTLLFFCLFFCSVLSMAQNLGHGYEFPNNGKSDKKRPLSQTFTATPAPIDTIILQQQLDEVLAIQTAYLANKKAQLPASEAPVDLENLKQVTALLKNSVKEGKITSSQFEFYQIKGEDGLGNVHFTGYFVPVLRARSAPDAVYKYPLYRLPKLSVENMPTRNQIDFGQALAGQQLELAYTANLLDNYMMQVQGSGMVEYRDGNKELLSYGGTNGKKYSSIGKYLVKGGQVTKEKISFQAIRTYLGQHPDSVESVLSQNESYTFFTRSKNQPIGAAGVTLSADHTVAVDPKVIPLGSILLAKIPVLDDKGRLVKHEFRLVVAQDSGGAVKGAGHVDLYFGIGDPAGENAGRMHHYGEMWLIKPL